MARGSRLLTIIVALLVLMTALGTHIIYTIYKGSQELNLTGGLNRNELQIPVQLEDTNPDPDTAEYVLTVQTGQTSFVNGLTTATLGYNGDYLGPLLRFRQGEKVNIRVENSLDFATTIHWHGLVVDGDQDGGPHQGIQPGDSWNPSFTVDQPAATLWYHPHLMGNTANQVYYGLAGLIYIDDQSSAELGIPKDYGKNDYPLIIQDRSIDRSGSFAYRTTMMGVIPGETILVNGTVNPYLNVARELVRFRILNGSNSENFYLRLSDNSSFQQIASDGGFLSSPVTKSTLFLAPGERAEIIVDFSKITQDALSLLNGNNPILDFHNMGQEGKEMLKTPESLAIIQEIPLGEKPRTRLFELQSMGINGTINGKYFDMERIDEEVNLNESEIWIIRNIAGVMQTGGHPFHVHGTQFQVITRNGREPSAEERGFKDTVYVGVGEEVVIKVRFTHTGVYMYHCHILEHEDGGMMGQFRVK